MASIREIAGLRDSLMETLGRGARVVLDCSMVEHADLSVIQLILAVRHMAERDGLALSLIIPPSGVVADLIRQSGLDHEFPDNWSQ